MSNAVWRKAMKSKYKSPDGKKCSMTSWNGREPGKLE
jgi:hypothetical protein